MQLLAKTAIITGAGSGIGKAAAMLFAKEGAAVCLVSRTEEELRGAVSEIERAGGRAIYHVADVSAPDEMKRAVAAAVEAFGGLDIVFANAGVNGVWSPIEEIEPDEWDDTLNTNLKGTFLTVKYAIPHLKKEGGSIVITASVNGTRIFSNAGATAYSCSKAAQVAFTKMAALELAKHKIRVNVICPGAIDTEIDDSSQKRDAEKEREPVEFPAGRIPLTNGKPGTSEQVAQLVLFLASDASSHRHRNAGLD